MNKYFNTIIVILLFFLNSCSRDKNITQVEIQQKEFDFGQISLSDSLEVSFSIKNVSKNHLKVNKVGTSCGCTTTKYTKGNILKNETATINVLFKPNQIGHIEKSVVVETNTDPPYHVFYIKGSVVE